MQPGKAGAKQSAIEAHGITTEAIVHGFRTMAGLTSVQRAAPVQLCVYIYIYICIERERYIYVYTYIYIHTYILYIYI